MAVKKGYHAERRAPAGTSVPVTGTPRRWGSSSRSRIYTGGVIPSLGPRGTVTVRSIQAHSRTHTLIYTCTFDRVLHTSSSSDCVCAIVGLLLHASNCPVASRFSLARYRAHTLRGSPADRSRTCTHAALFRGQVCDRRVHALSESTCCADMGMHGIPIARDTHEPGESPVCARRHRRGHVLRVAVPPSRFTDGSRTELLCLYVYILPTLSGRLSRLVSSLFSLTPVAPFLACPAPRRLAGAKHA